MDIWVIDVLVVLGVALLAISVFGMLWLPDVYTKLHAASKGGFVGTSLIVLAAVIVNGPGMVSHGVLILAFMVLTAPLSAHAIGHAAWLARDEPSHSGGRCDPLATRDGELAPPGRAESDPSPAER